MFLFSLKVTRHNVRSQIRQFNPDGQSSIGARGGAQFYGSKMWATMARCKDTRHAQDSQIKI